MYLKRRFFIAVMLIVTMFFTTSMAFAASAVSAFDGKNYTHGSQFDNSIVIDGIDVSAYQEEIDWTKVKTQGIDFAIVKVGGTFFSKNYEINNLEEQNAIYSDSMFKKHIEGAKQAGLMVGVYYFSQAVTESESIEEAQWVLEKIKGYDLELPVFMDYEYERFSNYRIDSLSKDVRTANAKAFFKTIEDAGYNAGFYSNVNFLENEIDGEYISNNYFTWVARYNPVCDYVNGYNAWQYTDNGKVVGILKGKTTVDCNFWYLNNNPVETCEKSIVNCEIQLTEDCLKYDPQVCHKPGVTVTYQGNTLTEGVDYKVDYIKNNLPGNAYAYVQGIGEYRDYALKCFAIETEKPEPVKLTAPSVKAMNVESSGKPKLTWNAVNGAEKYEIYRAMTKTGTYQYMYSTSGTSYTNTSAKAETTYYYKVRAVSTKTEFVNSDFSSVVTRTCDLAQPTIKVTSVASSGKPRVTWTPVTGADKYYIYRATSKGGTYTKMYTTTGTAYTNTSAKPENTYYYKVRAISTDNSGANSAYSAVKNRTCDLARPTVTISRSSSGKPKLSWKAVSGADKYYIYRATSKNGTYKKVYTVSSKGRSYTNTSATKGRTYYYKVRAISTKTSYANSAYSSIKYIKSR